MMLFPVNWHNLFLLSERTNEWTFLGATDAIEEESWKWADGSAFGFTRWAGGEPNGGTDENCLEMDSYVGDGGWNDTPCGFENAILKGYVCAHDAGE